MESGMMGIGIYIKERLKEFSIKRKGDGSI